MLGEFSVSLSDPFFPQCLTAGSESLSLSCGHIWILFSLLLLVL
nr:MAG TPA: hypothetical protein [Bacteriophage sp.]